jgi:hypothetical protein
MFLRAQFYAEDGKFWYAQAYNLGWLHSLAIPLGGYLNTLPRLVAGITLLFPLQHAPLIMNLAGMLIQTMPAMVLLSPRSRNWGPLYMRILMAAIYVAVPGAFEVHVVLTNAQWHLALAELLIAFSNAPRSVAGRVFDSLIFAVGSISGPFPVLIVPLALIFWWKRRQAWTLVLTAILGVGAVVQAFYVIFIGRPKVGDLGATPMLLVRMVGGNIFLDAICGRRFFAFHLQPWLLLLAATLGVAFVLSAVARAGLEFRLSTVFAWALMLNAIRAPFMSEGGLPLWQQLVRDPGGRYWYYPILSFLWLAAWCVSRRPSRALVAAGYCILLPMLAGVFLDWRYQPFADHHFDAYVQKLAAAQPGEHVVIPIYPDPYTMELIKK